MTPQWKNFQEPSVALIQRCEQKSLLSNLCAHVKIIPPSAPKRTQELNAQKVFFLLSVQLVCNFTEKTDAKKDC